MSWEAEAQLEHTIFGLNMGFGGQMTKQGKAFAV